MPGSRRSAVLDRKAISGCRDQRNDSARSRSTRALRGSSVMAAQSSRRLLVRAESRKDRCTEPGWSATLTKYQSVIHKDSVRESTAVVLKHPADDGQHQDHDAKHNQPDREDQAQNDEERTKSNGKRPP